jgi:hypothetical protein
VSIPTSGVDLLTETRVVDVLEVPGGGVAVVRERVDSPGAG